ncbi:hypothetical protein XHV734_0125 [Xanthomonas hortorum pv. vitians]|nr:hypothetical protein XHV734_0125 [Xanthomonas hortorum pv. vitians]
MSGQGPVKMVGMHGCKQGMTCAVWITARPISFATQRDQQAGFQKSNRLTFWCGVLAACGTVWRHGCRHRAYMDVLAACPASGEGTARSTDHAFDLQRLNAFKQHKSISLLL